MQTVTIRQGRPSADGFRIEPQQLALTRQHARQFYQDCLCITVQSARLLIDLTALEQIDSHGLGALLALDEHFQADGGIRLIAGKPRWQTLLDITRLQHLLLEEG